MAILRDQAAVLVHAVAPSVGQIRDPMERDVLKEVEEMEEMLSHHRPLHHYPIPSGLLIRTAT